MANPYKPLIPARMCMDSFGTPVSELYGDVYHSRGGALAQAEHVFLRGNQLPGRWHGRDVFTVAETGFGLGWNFLALWQAWRADPNRPTRLHVVSFEAHPFSGPDLAQMIVPDMPDRFLSLARQLLAAWPSLLPGLHRLEFESGALTLTLAFGPIEVLARQIEACVDAYFLDGFAPRNNPQMWSASLFGQLARMANVGATAASWCCAGQVRRTLSDAGFLVSKVAGFGQKREMTVAVLRPGLGRSRESKAPTDPILVIGGGLAGAGIAHSLALRGHAVTVADPVFAQGLGASHKGHRAAALTPLISRDDDQRARLTRAGTLRALQRWGCLPVSARPLRCGTIELPATEHDAIECRETLKYLSFPADWVSWLDRAQASRKVGFPVARGGVFFTHGQLVRPEALIEALLDHPAIRCIATDVAGLKPLKQGIWQARDMFGASVAQASNVVLANAARAKVLLSSSGAVDVLPKVRAIHQLAGQVSYFSSVAAAGHESRVILGGEGYWLPAVDRVCVGGSTYVPGADHCEVTGQGHQAVINKLTALLNVSSVQASAWLDSSNGWAGWRAVTMGRLPVIGPLAATPGLWLACAYGSRGLTWSALAGDIIAARLNREPSPVERDLLRAIAPR